MTKPQTPGQRPGVHDRTGDDIPPVQEYVEYHWSRIFAALAVVAILVTGAVYGVRAFLSDSEPSRVALPDSAVPATPEALPAVSTPALSVPPAISEPESEQYPDSPERREIVAAGADVSQQDTGSGETVTPEGALAAETDGMPGSSDVPGTMPPDETESATEVAANRGVAAPTADEARVEARVEILAPALARAQLTQGLEDKEPVDELPGQLAMNDQGLLRVYLFTETRGLKGQLHFHDWYLNGQRVARVRIQPYADEMRASSSKFIDRNMTGEWRVEVVMASGERLATGAFVVTP